MQDRCIPLVQVAHTEMLGVPRSAPHSPTLPRAKGGSVSRRSCQHHEGCQEAGAVWNTHICNAESALWQGGEAAGGSSHSEPVTQPRGATSLRGKNRLKEEDGEEHNGGRETRKSQTKFQAVLTALLIMLGSTIHRLHSLHHVGIKWKITSISLIKPAFLCHGV